MLCTDHITNIMICGDGLPDPRDRTSAPPRREPRPQRAARAPRRRRPEAALVVVWRSEAPRVLACVRRWPGGCPRRCGAIKLSDAFRRQLLQQHDVARARRVEAATSPLSRNRRRPRRTPPAPGDRGAARRGVVVAGRGAAPRPRRGRIPEPRTSGSAPRSAARAAARAGAPRRAAGACSPLIGPRRRGPRRGGPRPRRRRPPSRPRRSPPLRSRRRGRAAGQEREPRIDEIRACGRGSPRCCSPRGWTEEIIS